MAIPPFLPPRLRHAAEVVRDGGLIAYPTEGVYGLGCRPDDPLAVGRLLRLKERPVEAGLILIAASLGMLDGWIAPAGAELERLEGVNDGPVTWVVTAGALTPVWITGGRDTVAVRVTTHPIAAALCLASGHPLVSTSANRRGRGPALSATGVRLRFGPAVDLVVGGSTGGSGRPSEIRDAGTGRVFRSG